MGETTGIAWTDSTFNPWVGCTKISPGCTNCYAADFDKRVGGGKNADGVKRLRWGKGAERVRTSVANWKKPLAWNKRAALTGVRHKVFCSSLADVCDEEVPAAWRSDLAHLIERTPHLDWLLLTKRPENFGLFDVAWDIDVCPERGDWPSNVWLGVTVENQEQAERRIPLLLEQDASVRFLSMEPLLESVQLDVLDAGVFASLSALTGEMSFAGRGGFGGHSSQRYDGGIDWVIVGGESGPRARPFHFAWARDLKRQCADAGVAFFMKQLGSTRAGAETLDDLQKLEALRDRAGADPAEWPEDLRVQQFPVVTR